MQKHAFCTIKLLGVTPFQDLSIHSSLHTCRVLIQKKESLCLVFSETAPLCPSRDGLCSQKGSGYNGHLKIANPLDAGGVWRIGPLLEALEAFLENAWNGVKVLGWLGFNRIWFSLSFPLLSLLHHFVTSWLSHLYLRLGCASTTFCDINLGSNFSHLPVSTTTDVVVKLIRAFRFSIFPPLSFIASAGAHNVYFTLLRSFIFHDH